MILKKDVTPQVKRSIEALHLGGIVWGELSSERLYADGDLMGALLGGVNDNGDGVAGIEQVENKTLTGTDGHETYQRGNGGEEIPGTMTESVAAKNGDDVTLTIDRDVQWYVKKVSPGADAGVHHLVDVYSGNFTDDDQFHPHHHCFWFIA